MQNRQFLGSGGLTALLLCVAAACHPGAASAQTALTASLSASAASPAPVGAIVTWTATATGTPSGNLWYRFRVRDAAAGAPCPDTPPRLMQVRSRGVAAQLLPARVKCAAEGFSTVRDYGPVNTLDWTASEHEGDYEIEASVRDEGTGVTALAVSRFHFMPSVTGDAPEIHTTANPLVFLYSAPPCAEGSTMRVQFQGPDGFLQGTNSKPCDGRTMNFYLAGMRPLTAYTVWQVVESGSQAETGPSLMLQVPDAPFSFGARTVLKPPPSPFADPVILQSRFGWPAATDAMGNLLWYSLQDVSMIARPEPGGRFLGWVLSSTLDTAHQVIREFDLAGTTLRETNAARINEQLAAMGMHPIIGFHHEVRGMPDGGILALSATERILTDVQGPGPVDVLGDIILVLDRDLQVRWAWDAFDHLDPHRMATLGETCTAAGGGCPPIQLAPVANDWTHGNSLELTADGNLLYSARHQDWIIKIDFRNGTGTGNILWRLGKDGDFQFVSADPYPWFSHQHDANLGAGGMLTVFDNGNVRNAADPAANSRGQVIRIDEANRLATVVVNADLGDFSMALGSAQELPDGGFHFHLGYIPKGNVARIVEVDRFGNIIYNLELGELQYRSFRMQDLYTP